MVEKIDELKNIQECIENNNNFLLSGGAGSGKTYSLVQTINFIKENYNNKSIACITYTNAAVNEIKNRVVDNKNLKVSTIHDFLWENIKKFQKELRKCIVELINEEQIKFNDENIQENYFDGMDIQYKEYLDIKNGIISHDEVILISNKMYSEYKVLCDILKDKYDFILVDEYQDTNKFVIEILLDCLKKSSKKSIIGFYGDSMQSIYNDGVGDLKNYIENGEIIEIQKKQNRRNPLKVIELANKIRTDGLIQEPSDDIEAPNMENGRVKLGEIKFIYSEDFIEYEELKVNQIFQDWNFGDHINTKELDLTHNLIANRAGFGNLMEIYDKDPILKLKQELVRKIANDIINEDCTFEEILNQYPQFKTKIETIKRDETTNNLYNTVKDKAFREIRKMYFSKDSLIDDKKLSVEEVKNKGRKRDVLINQLFRIQYLISLYENKNFNEFIKKTDFFINRLEDKKIINEKIIKLKEKKNQTVEQVIDTADELGICIKDDKFKTFIADNEYLYNRVKKLKYEEFKNLFKYIEGYTPFSTQHKVKGAEFNNVLVILDNGNWNQYNFEYLFTETGNENVLKRTQKIFYVCCTRAKERLYVYYCKPSIQAINKAKVWFGEENVIKL